MKNINQSLKVLIFSLLLVIGITGCSQKSKYVPYFVKIKKDNVSEKSKQKILNQVMKKYETNKYSVSNGCINFNTRDRLSREFYKNCFVFKNNSITLEDKSYYIWNLGGNRGSANYISNEGKKYGVYVYRLEKSTKIENEFRELLNQYKNTK